MVGQPSKASEEDVQPGWGKVILRLFLGLCAIHARLDFSASAVEFLPTPFSEGHLLVGVQEDRAVFVGPNGGMAFVPIR